MKSVEDLRGHFPLKGFGSLNTRDAANLGARVNDINIIFKLIVLSDQCGPPRTGNDPNRGRHHVLWHS